MILAVANLYWHSTLYLLNVLFVVLTPALIGEVWLIWWKGGWFWFTLLQIESFIPDWFLIILCIHCARFPDLGRGEILYLSLSSYSWAHLLGIHGINRSGSAIRLRYIFFLVRLETIWIWYFSRHLTLYFTKLWFIYMRLVTLR